MHIKQIGDETFIVTENHILNTSIIEHIQYNNKFKMNILMMEKVITIEGEEAEEIWEMFQDIYKEDL